MRLLTELKVDFTSTMDVVMTPEERAEMKAAADQGDPAAKEALKATASGIPASTGEASSSTTIPASTAGATSTAPGATGHVHDHTGDPSNTSLAHHSAFPASSSSSSTGVSKKDAHTGKDKKGKPKLSPEQKAQLDALEKKQEKEKKAR